jgi:phage baseplate assembly protein W
MTTRGIAFPFNKSKTSFPAVKEDDDLIEDNIRRILLTKRNERVMRPDVGSDMFDFVFENIGSVMRAGITQETRRALGANEPRVRVLDVSVEQQQNATGGTEVLVIVTYEANRQRKQTALTI